MDKDQMSGYSSSSDESVFGRRNYDQDLTQSAPLFNLQRAVRTFDASALVSSAPMATGVLPTPTITAPSPTVLLPPPPRATPGNGNIGSSSQRPQWANEQVNQNPLQQVNRNPPAQNFLCPTRPYPRRPENIGLYDPLYETMGLPVDPHLRAFLFAGRNDGKD